MGKTILHSKNLLIWIYAVSIPASHSLSSVDWLQSLKQFFINVSYHILVASLTLMALFLKQNHKSKTSYKYMVLYIDEKLFQGLEPVYFLSS